MNIADKVKHIKTKFLKADYLLHSVNDIFSNLQRTFDAENWFIFPQSLFDEDQYFAGIHIPFCEWNESKAKFLSKNSIISLME